MMRSFDSGHLCMVVPGIIMTLILHFTTFSSEVPELKFGGERLTQKEVMTILDDAWSVRFENDEELLNGSRLGLIQSVRIDYLRGAALAMGQIGWTYQTRGEFKKALGVQRSALQLREILGDTVLIAGAKTNIGVCLRNLGYYKEAEKCFIESYFLLNPQKHEHLATDIIDNLGRVYKWEGKWKESEYCFRHSLYARRLRGDRLEEAQSLKSLGELAELKAEFRVAEGYYLEALKVFQEEGRSKLAAHTLHGLGNVYKQTGQPQKAIIALKQSELIGEKYLDSLSLGKVYRSLADAMFELGKNEKGKKYLKMSERTFRNRDLLLDHTLVLADLAELELEEGNPEKAKDLAEKALDQSGPLNSLLIKVELYEVLTDANTILSEFKEANRLGRKLKTIQDSLETAYRENVVNEKKMMIAERERDQAASDALFYKMKSEKNLAILFFVFLLSIFLLGFLVVFILYYKTQLKLSITQHEVQESQAQVEHFLKKEEILAFDHMAEGREAERKHMARELHDGVCGDLTAIKFLAQSGGNGLENVVEQIDKTLQTVRLLSHKLETGENAKFGLEEALQLLAQAVYNSGVVSVEYISSGLQKRLDYGMEVHIYRIAQELFSNMLKYSEASEVTVQLLKREGSVHFSFEDNGIGFNTNAPEYQPGIGLNNIRERVKNLNGSMDLDTGLGAGTSYHIEIPINNLNI